jgi:hypothetical protein
MSGADKVNALLVAGGRWHDVDYARAELLVLLAEHDVVRTRVADDYGSVGTLSADTDVLVSWTCDVRPTPEQGRALVEFVRRGGRWLALHGSTSAIDAAPPGGERLFRTPRVLGEVAEVLGSQFLAHPPIAPFRVDVCAPEHPLVAGVGPFTITDELYVSEIHEPIETLLASPFTGSCRGFEEGQNVSGNWPVLHLKDTGAGTTCVFTLGHCRGRFDVQDQGIDDLGVVDRVAWGSPEYRLLLSRLVAWAVHGDAWQGCERVSA